MIRRAGAPCGGRGGVAGALRGPFARVMVKDVMVKDVMVIDVMVKDIMVKNVFDQRPKNKCCAVRRRIIVE